MTKAIPTILSERLSSIVRKKDVATMYGPIGVELGSDGLRMVQLKRTGTQLAIQAAARVHIPEEIRNSVGQSRSLLKQALKEYGFVGREIVTCMQPQDVKIMMLSFMRQPDKTDEELIVNRVAERVDGNIDDYVIDFIMVRPVVKDVQERSVLVAIAKHDDVIEYLEYLRRVGMVVKLLEIGPTAMRRLISVKHDELDTNLMTISMGQAQTYISVLSGRRLIYERDIDFGENQLIATLCKELDINEHEAHIMLERGDFERLGVVGDSNGSPVTQEFFSVLKPLFMELVEDINRALIYAASETRGVPVKQVYLTNHVATWQGIEKFINTLIEVPVSVLMPFDSFENAGSFSDGSDPRNVVATGMALHGLTEHN